MTTRINLLPDELILEIYKQLFNNYCIPELIKKTEEKICQQCYKKTSMVKNPKIKIINCVRCNRNICSNCNRFSYRNGDETHFVGWCHTCVWMELN